MGGKWRRTFPSQLRGWTENAGCKGSILSCFSLSAAVDRMVSLLARAILTPPSAVGQNACCVYSEYLIKEIAVPLSIRRTSKNGM